MNWNYQNIQIFSAEARCCHAQKVLELSNEAKQQGWTDCMNKDMYRLLLLNRQICTLQRYAPQGSIIRNEALASFIFTVSAGSGHILTTLIKGISVATTASGISTDAQFAHNIATDLNVAFLTITALKGYIAVNLAGTDSVTIFAPVGSGAGANGTIITFVQTGGHVVQALPNVSPYLMTGGITQVIASEPCLTDKQARTLFETIQSYCGGCTTCNDDLIFNDIN